MNTIEIVKALREEAVKNPVANDVFTVWSIRERSRIQVSIAGLMQRMVKEGFKHSPHDYAAFLRFLAKLGLGSLQGSGGRVTALVGIKWTLKSIGDAALGEKGHLTIFRLRNRFKALPGDDKKVRPTPQVVTQIPKETAGADLALTVSINGKNIIVPLPRDLSSEDIGLLVARLQPKGS